MERTEDELELKKLMMEACAGDRESSVSLLRRVESLLRPFVKNRLVRAGASGAEEEDVLQEILLGIHAKRHTFHPDHAFLPWMYAIARYKTIDFLRSARVRRKTRSIDDPEAPIADLVAIDAHPGDRLDVQAGISKLSAKQRDLLRLVKLEGLSVKEASLKTGFSPSDIRVSVHRGLKALKRILGGSNDENG